jgi:hypothetical protein
MRKFFTLLYVMASIFAQAQEPQMVNEAIIKTETEFFGRTENLEEAGNGHFSGVDLIGYLNVGRDGRVTLKATTYVKDSLCTTIVKNRGLIWTNIRNYESGLTSSFQEYDFYFSHSTTDVYFLRDTQIIEELKQKNMKLAAIKKDTIEIPQVKVYYQDITKTIAGFPCKRAILYLLYSNGKTGKIMVWYNEGVKLKYLASTGDPNFVSLNKYIGMPANQFNLLAAVKGFPMEYEMKLDKDVYITVTVTELELNKSVKNRYFKIPSDHWDIIYNKTPWVNRREAPEFGPIVSDRSNEDN